jgi:hypothetical protein
MVHFSVAVAGSPPVAAPLGGEEQGGNGMVGEGGSTASAQPSQVSAHPRHGGAGKARTPCGGSALNQSATSFN